MNKPAIIRALNAAAREIERHGGLIAEWRSANNLEVKRYWEMQDKSRWIVMSRGDECIAIDLDPSSP